MLDIPEMPAAVVALLGFLSPFLSAVVNRDEWTPNQKRVVAVILSFALTALVLVMAWARGLVELDLRLWPEMLLLGLVVQQAAYSLLLKPAAAVVEERTNQRGNHRE